MWRCDNVVAVQRPVDEASEQLRGCIHRRVDAEGGALARSSREKVDESVTLVVPELWYLCSWSAFSTWN